jgi:hypothetical protein
VPDIAPHNDHSIVQEASGACGDLGTFIPHVIGAMTVAGRAPVGVLSGFGIFLIATGLFYGLPLPVQPMKTVSAVILTGGLRPGELAAAGMMIGVVLLVLGYNGLDRSYGARNSTIGQRGPSTRSRPPDGGARAQTDAANAVGWISCAGSVDHAIPHSALSGRSASASFSNAKYNAVKVVDRPSARAAMF